LFGYEKKASLEDGEAFLFVGVFFITGKSVGNDKFLR
jgi:hypothetical protein